MSLLGRNRPVQRASAGSQPFRRLPRHLTRAEQHCFLPVAERQVEMFVQRDADRFGLGAARVTVAPQPDVVAQHGRAARQRMGAGLQRDEGDVRMRQGAPATELCEAPLGLDAGCPEPRVRHAAAPSARPTRRVHHPGRGCRSAGRRRRRAGRRYGGIGRCCAPPTRPCRPAVAGTPGWWLRRRRSGCSSMAARPAAKQQVCARRHQVGVGVPAMRSYFRKYWRAKATSWACVGWSTVS